MSFFIYFSICETYCTLSHLLKLIAQLQAFFYSETKQPQARSLVPIDLGSEITNEILPQVRA